MEQLLGTALGGQSLLLLPSLFPKYVFPLGPFVSPSPLAVLLLLEELVGESGLSLHTAGVFIVCFPQVRRKEGKRINQTLGVDGEQQWKLFSGFPLLLLLC